MTPRAATPLSAAVTAALAATVTAALVLLCAGCTTPAGGAGQSSGAAQPEGEASYPTTPPPRDGSAPPGDRATDATDMTTSWPGPSTSTATQIATTPALPGGTGDTAALAAAGELTGDGRVDLHGGGTPAGSTDNADLCTFLFGAPDEIASITRLAGDITLDPISGRHQADTDAPADTSAPADTNGSADTGASNAATGSTAIACVYQTGGAPILALQVGDGPPIDPDLPGQPIIVDADGLHAVLSYSPDHLGPTIDPAKARAYLAAVISRVTTASVGGG